MKVLVRVVVTEMYAITDIDNQFIACLSSSTEFISNNVPKPIWDMGHITL